MYSIHLNLKYFLIAFSLTTFIALLLHFAIQVNAAEQIDQQQTTTSNGTARDDSVHYQTFNPTKNNISSFTLGGDCTGGGTQVLTINWDLEDSNGFLIGGTATTSQLCNGAGFAFNIPIRDVETGLAYGYAAYNFYTFRFNYVSNSIARFSYAYAGNPALMYSDQGTGWNYYFKDYYEETGSGIASSTEIMIGDPDFFSHSGFFLKFKDVNYCNISATSTCVLDFTFNDKAIGKTLYGYYYNESTGTTSAAYIASTTIVYNGTDKAKITLPSITTTGILRYYFIMSDPTGVIPAHFWANVIVDWIDLSNIQSILGSLKTYDISQACNGMTKPTSTTFLDMDQFVYSIECSFRKVTYWAFQPSLDTQLAWINNQHDLKEIFPLNIYTQSKDMILGAVNTYASSTATTTSQGIPITVAGGTTYIDLLNLNGIETAFSPSLWTTINDDISIIFYIMTFLYLLSELIGIEHEKTDESKEIVLKRN